MSVIACTTVAKALKSLAPGYSLTVKDNKDELLRHLNVIRGMLYAMYNDVEVAVDRRVCLKIETYQLDCHKCQTTYRGITLPYDAASAENLKIYGRSVSRNSGYKDVHECGCLEGWDVIGQFPTQREIPQGSCGQLGFYSECRQDCDAEVTVTFLDQSGDERTETVVVNGETKLGATVVKSVSLPEDRKGKISVYLKQPDDDLLLSTYRRSETCPQYNRIRFNIGCCPSGHEVDVIYAREYLEVFDDDEIVETANPYVLQELGAYMRLNSRSNNSATDRAEAEIHRRQAMNAIRGLQTRSEGHSMDVVLNIKDNLSKRSGLASKRYDSYRSWGRYGGRTGGKRS